jgi:hypothetical protein
MLASGDFVTPSQPAQMPFHVRVIILPGWQIAII